MEFNKEHRGSINLRTRNLESTQQVVVLELVNNLGGDNAGSYYFSVSQYAPEGKDAVKATQLVIYKSSSGDFSKSKALEGQEVFIGGD